MLQIRSMTVVAALLIAAATAAAADDAVTADLRPGVAKPELRLRRDAVYLVDNTFAKPAEGAGTVHAGAMTAARRDAKVRIAVAIDATTPEAPAPDVLRLDFTGQGRFEGAPVVPLKSYPMGGGSFYAPFGPELITVQRGGEILPVWVEGFYNRSRGQRSLWLETATAREGICRFGDRSCAVQVLDGSLNLAVNDRTAFARDHDHRSIGTIGDTLAIDVGDGSFAADTVVRAFVGQPVQVDGRWYRVTVADDQKSLSAAPWTGPLGHLRIDHDDWWCLLIGDDSAVVVRGGRQDVPVPAGTYEVVEGRQILRGQRPGSLAWEAERNVAAATVTIEAGRTAVLAVGAPIALKVRAAVDGRRVSMDLEQLDAAGLPVSGITVGDAARGRRPPAPRLTVTDADGKIVHRGTFDYG
ncbi:MAG: hypothetical protein GX591_18715 [Planctomycetes bacterium]|nr:hypothetical protein [Planctomycetota bacterium]